MEKFGTTTTLPRAGRPAKLSNREKGLGQGGDQELMVSLTELQSSSVEMVVLLENSPISAALHQSGLLWWSGQMEATLQ